MQQNTKSTENKINTSHKKLKKKCKTPKNTITQESLATKKSLN